MTMTLSSSWLLLKGPYCAYAMEAELPNSCNLEAPSLNPALTANWICSRLCRVQILGHAFNLPRTSTISAIDTAEGIK